MSYSLGIDFGTSSTKISLQADGGIPFPLALSSNGNYIPSVVAFEKTENGKVKIKAIGDAAENLEHNNNIYIIRDIKRFLFPYKILDDGKLKEKYPLWNDSEKCITIGNTRIKVEEIVFNIMMKAIEEAVVYLRDMGLTDNIDSITIRGLPINMACPVSADLNMRRSLLRVAKCAGFSNILVKNILEEPILAALSYVKQQEFSSNDTKQQENRPNILLIYDFGGGTFDTAIVRVDKDLNSGNPIITVLAVDSEPFCGGSDIDHYFCSFIKDKLIKNGKLSQEEIDVLMKNDTTIQKECRKAKEFLSDHDEFTFDLLFSGTNPMRLKFTTTRKEFEESLKNSGLISKSHACVLRAWRRARMVLKKPGENISTIRDVMKYKWQDLDSMVTKVLMVGGTTQIPYVQSSLRNYITKAEFISSGAVKPIEACSIGAAYQWNLIEHSVNKIVDRLSFSICINFRGTNIPLYEAYQPIVEYKHTNRLEPIIDEYKTLNPVDCDGIPTVRLIDGDDERLDIEMPFEDLRAICNGPYYVKIDRFGYITIHGKNGSLEIPNPDQHPTQREAKEQIAKKKQLEEQSHHNWLRDLFRKRPGEDHNTDVG